MEDDQSLPSREMVEGREKELRVGPGPTMTYSMYALNYAAV